MEGMLGDQCTAITQICVEQVFEGNSVALRLAMERVLSPRKSRPVMLHLPERQTVEDIMKAQDALMQSASDGVLTLDEANQFFALFEAKCKTIEIFDLEERLQEIEAHLELE
jgi:hypothetical protein